MTSTQELTATLESELTALRARRDELKQDTLDANASLSNARAALVSGTGDVGAVTDAQSRYTALREALTALDERIDQTGVQLEDARANEHRAELVLQLAQFAQDGQDNWRAMQEIYIEASEVLEPVMARLAEAHRRLVGTRRNFIALAATETPQIMQPRPDKAEAPYLSPTMARAQAQADVLIDEVKAVGAQIDAVAMPWENTDVTLFDVNMRGVPWPQARYGYVIAQAFEAACRDAARAK